MILNHPVFVNHPKPSGGWVETSGSEWNQVMKTLQTRERAKLVMEEKRMIEQSIVEEENVIVQRSDDGYMFFDAMISAYGEGSPTPTDD
jgi:hypothetical protein